MHIGAFVVGEGAALMVIVTAVMVALLTFVAFGGARRAGQGVAHARRVGAGLALGAGRAPVQITFEGRNFDVLVGLSAPLIGWLVATKRIGVKGVVTWNVLGLAVLANTVGTVASSTPGPLHLDWPGAPFTAITTWPVVWLPAFLMPTAVFLHVVSLRQNLRRLRHCSTP